MQVFNLKLFIQKFIISYCMLLVVNTLLLITTEINSILPIVFVGSFLMNVLIYQGHYIFERVEQRIKKQGAKNL